MITDESFPVEPWQVRETRLDLDLLAQSESLFTLSNGHVGLRGNLDEGEPYGLPVDEWGIRVDENSRPVGSCVARGGASYDAAAVYAVS